MGLTWPMICFSISPDFRAGHNRKGGVKLPNPVLHFDIPAGDDPDKLYDFYRSLFQWKVNTDNPMNYGLVDTETETGINGGINPQAGTQPLTVYVEVDDLQAYLDRAEELGGETIMAPAEEVPGILSLASFRDPAGNVIGLSKREQS